MGWKDDVRTVMERDPAVKSFNEALFFSQGLHAIILQRASHRAYLKGNFFMARMVNYWARVLTGADIHPGATIGKGCRSSQLACSRAEAWPPSRRSEHVRELAEIGQQARINQCDPVGQTCITALEVAASPGRDGQSVAGHSVARNPCHVRSR